MASFVGLIKRNSKLNNPPQAELKEGALRCGILGAAKIAPDGIIKPARSHSEFTIYAVAARDKEKADDFAKKYGIPKVYSGSTGYQDMLDNPEVDVIYNPLPTGLHYEWTLKALKAGKHVLLEKPSTNTEEEIKFLFDYAQQKGLVLLEALHSRFHPANKRVKEVIESGELGNLKHISGTLCVPKQMRLFEEDDIRYKYELGGGILMDMGSYPLAMSRYLIGAEPTSVLSADAEVLPNPRDEVSKRNIDIGATASLVFPNDVTASIKCHACMEGWGPFGLLPRMPEVSLVATCEGGTVEIYNYVTPSSYHSIIVKPTNGKKRIEKVYKSEEGVGEEWWSTYRYQLENFVDKIKGREPRLWMDGQSSVSNLHWLEKIYEKNGLGSRPKSGFVLGE